MLIDVILPLPLRAVYTYAVPEGQTAEIGVRVLVPLGAKRTYVGIVYKIHQASPQPLPQEGEQVSASSFPPEGRLRGAFREAIAIFDEQAVVLPLQLKCWEWIADYHQCALGEVYKAALPAKMKADLTKRKRKSPKKKTEQSDAPLQELSALNEYQQKAYESIKNIFNPKFSNPPSQREINPVRDYRSVEIATPPENASHRLAPNQQAGDIPTECRCENAASIYRAGFPNGNQPQNVALLHGVTSSGKTEIYIHLIEETLKQGKQALYLLPEIALTTQITERLKKVFGNKLAVYHSKMTDTQRAEVWEKLIASHPPPSPPDGGCVADASSSPPLEGLGEAWELEGAIILGVRSSVLLPFSNLGLIIVDEEHESSYKQYDPAPRYHARDTAIMLAHLHGAKVLLGTATPSVETYRNVQLGKYGLVELMRRHQDIALPKIIVSDVKMARKRKQMKSHFSPLLLEKIEEALDRKEQIILFQNRRGFAPMLECKQCAWVPRCKHCDVSLTYHKANHKLSCHYCGAVYSPPKICPLCRGDLETKGFGTEKIEEDIQEFFPGIKVARLDLDSTRKKNAYEETIKGFEQGEIDILIGTQMITKGLDFERVSVVGILNADNMLNYPDFRSHERAFQLMAQVAGRAGRKGRQGTVVLQTSNPEHPIIQQVIDNNYKAMYANQIEERAAFRYPPFVRLVKITLKDKSAEKVAQASHFLADELRKKLGAASVLGPDNPAIARVQNLHLKHILLKPQNNSSLKPTKETMRDCINELQKSADFKSVIVVVDVDPM